MGKEKERKKIRGETEIEKGYRKLKKEREAKKQCATSGKAGKRDISY